MMMRMKRVVQRHKIVGVIVGLSGFGFVSKYNTLRPMADVQ